MTLSAPERRYGLGAVSSPPPRAGRSQHGAAGPVPPAACHRAGLPRPAGGRTRGRPVLGRIPAAGRARDDDDRLCFPCLDEHHGRGGLRRGRYRPRRHDPRRHAVARGGDRAVAAGRPALARGGRGGRRAAADPRWPLPRRRIAQHHVVARHHERLGHGRRVAARHRPRRRRGADRRHVVRLRRGLAHHLRHRAVPRPDRGHRSRHRSAATAPLRPHRRHRRADRLPRRRLRRHHLPALGAGHRGRHPLHHGRHPEGRRALPGRRGPRPRPLLLRWPDRERCRHRRDGDGGHSADRPDHAYGQRRRLPAASALRRRRLRARRPHLPGRRPDR